MTNKLTDAELVEQMEKSRVDVLEEETEYLHQQLSRKDAVIEALLDKIERLEKE